MRLRAEALSRACQRVRRVELWVIATIHHRYSHVRFGLLLHWPHNLLTCIAGSTLPSRNPVIVFGVGIGLRRPPAVALSQQATR